jgi:hypothetical protein
LWRFSHRDWRSNSFGERGLRNATTLRERGAG